MKTKQIQQGDCLITQLNTMPEGVGKLISRKRCVLAHGESGHSHVVESEDAELIQIGERMLLKLETRAVVKHEEHGAITLEPGLYEIGRVNEYDYFAEMTRKVID